MLKSGEFNWNSGMFMFRADRLLAEMERLSPEIVQACRAAVDGAQRDLSFTRLDAPAFATNPNTSIDYAVMEKTDAAACRYGVARHRLGGGIVGTGSATDGRCIQ